MGKPRFPLLKFKTVDIWATKIIDKKLNFTNNIFKYRRPLKAFMF